MAQELGAAVDPRVEHEAHQAFAHAREHVHAAMAADATDRIAWLNGVQQAVVTLHDTLDHHRAGSELDCTGLLSEAVREKPALIAETTRLAREHTEMLERTRTIEIEIGRQMEFEEYKIDLVRLETEVLHAILHLHLLRADWLIYEIYFRTEGGEEG